MIAQNAGLTVAHLETLRKQMKQAGGSVKIAKNRLAKLALKETDNADMSALFTGPTVIAFAQDPMTAPKVAAAFADKNPKFVVLGGAMGKTGLDAANVKALATMPTLTDGSPDSSLSSVGTVTPSRLAHVFNDSLRRSLATARSAPSFCKALAVAGGI